jgi:IS5 family transposase
VAKRDERRPAGDLRSLAADNGCDDMSFRDKLRSEGVRPLIKHRVFVPYDHAHNAWIEDDLYNQRSVCETVNSVLKRSDGGAVRARAWYRQFREITLAAAVYNGERTLK